MKLKVNPEYRLSFIAVIFILFGLGLSAFREVFSHGNLVTGMGFLMVTIGLILLLVFFIIFQLSNKTFKKL